MTTEAALLLQGDPYEGLHDISRLCLDRLRVRIETVRPWHTLKPIMGGGPGVFDDIAAFFRGILNWLNWGNLEFQIRWKIIEPLGSWLRQHIFNPLREHLSYLVNGILGWWGGAINNVVTAIRNLPTVIQNAITNLPGALWNILTNVFNSLKAGIAYDLWLLGVIWNQIPASIRDPITNFANQITSRVQTLWEVFGGYFRELRDRLAAGLENLRAFIHNPLEGLRQMWARFEQTWAGQLLAQITTSLGAFVNMIITKLRELWARIQPIILDAAERALATARPYIERWVGEFKQLPATFLNWVAMSAGTDLAMHPSTSVGLVGSLYGMSIFAGSLAMTTATVLNLIPTTSWVGASQFAAFIAEAAAFEPVTRASYGVLLNEVLAMPLRYHWNMMLRPKLPTEGEIFIMGRKHGISAGEFRQAMAYMGIPDWWITKMYDFFWTDPSPMWLLRMTEGGIPRITMEGRKGPWLAEWLPGWQNDPLAWLKMKLMLAGYEDIDIDPMIEGMRMRALGPATTQVKTSVRAMLREAYWTKADAQDLLLPMGVRPEEVDLLYLAEELDYQKGYLNDQAMYYKEAFRKGDIDDQDLTLALSTIYVKPERVYQEVARERIRVLPKPKPITQPKEDPLVASLRKQATNSWFKQYRDWKIDENDLLLGLIIVLQDRDLAAKMVAVEKTRYRPLPPEPALPPEAPLVAKARREAIASWVAAFRTGEIDGIQLETYLQPLIPDAKIRLQVIQMELLRYTPPPAPVVPPSEAPLAAQIRRQAIASWVDAARKGEITFAELELYLEPLIPDRDTRVQVVNLEMLRYKPTPEILPPPSEPEELAVIRQEAVRGHIEMFQKRLIGIEQLYTFLLADGLVEPVARDTVITQATKRVRVPSLKSPYFLSDVIRALVDKGLPAYEQMFFRKEITIDQYVAWLTSLTVDPGVITYLADTLTLRRFLERL
uniref:Putative tail protein n=1 Tax=viral metagenome TaxID=1070528 RepID=A0A6M3XPX3_9ZZZZ